MWEMSKQADGISDRVVFFTMDEYCTGISQPAKSTIRPL